MATIFLRLMYSQTCKAIRAVTMSKGFARLWRQTHEQEKRAKAHLRHLRKYFEALDEAELETADADAERHHGWRRVIVPQEAVALFTRFHKIDAHVLATEVGDART